MLVCKAYTLFVYYMCLGFSLFVFALYLCLLCVNFVFGATHDNEICWFFGMIFMYQIWNANLYLVILQSILAIQWKWNLKI